MLSARDVLSWKPAVWPRIRYFLQVRQRIVFAGVLISALFAVLNPHAPLLFMAVCILTIGNLMYVLQTLSGRLYGNRPFPWNWVLYLPVLAAGSFASALATIAILRWMKPDIGPYWRLFHESWEIVMVVCMGAGIVSFAVTEVHRNPGPRFGRGMQAPHDG